MVGTLNLHFNNFNNLTTASESSVKCCSKIVRRYNRSRTNGRSRLDVAVWTWGQLGVKKNYKSVNKMYKLLIFIKIRQPRI